jgi:sulfur-oxidizing protein SoxB
MDLAVHRGVVVERSWQLLTVDDAIAGDPEVLALVEEARAPFLAAEVYMELPVPWVELPLTRSIDTVVGRVDRALHRRDVLENPFNTMLAEVIRQAGDSQISMTPGFRFDAVVLPRASVLADFDTTPGAAPAITSGDITLEQVYRFLPIAPSLAVGKIRGEDLRGIIELELTRVFSPDSFQHSGGWLGSFGGLEIEVDLAAADGERVRRMILSGSREPIRDDQTITVTSCIRPFDGDDFMCSNPGYMEITELENPATGRAWSPLELLVSEFESGRELGAGTSRVHDQGGRVLWPHGPFIQPLTAG